MEKPQAPEKSRNRKLLPIIIVLGMSIILGTITFFIANRSSSEPESLYSQYIRIMLELQEQGKTYGENDMSLQADYCYGIAGSSISAMRFAIDNMLHQKGEGKSLADLVEDAYGDWDTIAEISYVSPYPSYFEGLIYHIQGDKDKATEKYKEAILNPSFPQENFSFYYLSSLTTEELSVLRDELLLLEQGIYEVFTPKKTLIPRHPLNYEDEYLRAKAKAVLEEEPENYEMAINYYQAALQVNPFEGKNFAGRALLAIFSEDMEKALYYINEGLWIDEDSEELKQLAIWLTELDN